MAIFYTKYSLDSRVIRFHFASEGSGEEGRLTVWGRGAWSGFSGRDDDLSLDGDVATGMVGADFGRDDWLGGLMVSHSEGSGTYTTDGSGASGRSEGEIDSSLTGLYPYLGLDLTERVSVWGVGGYGRGALTLTREGEAPLETDIDMTMAAGGMRGEMLAAGETGADSGSRSRAMRSSCARPRMPFRASPPPRRT